MDSFNIKRLVARIIGYWYLYLMGLLLALLFATLYIRYTTPMYTVNAKVLVKDGSKGASTSMGDNESFNLFYNNENNLYNELAILQTTDLCLRVVEDMQLYKTYYYKGSVRDVELYDDLPFTVFYRPNQANDIIPVSIVISFDAGNNNFNIGVGDSSFAANFNDSFHLAKGVFCITKSENFKPAGTYLFTISDPLSVASSVAGNLSSSLLDKETSVINLTYKTPIPAKGRDVLNQVIKSYIERNLNEKNQLSDSTINFINSRIALVGGDLGTIESNIQHFKQQNKIADLPTQASQIITNSNNYNEQLNTLSVQSQVMTTMLDYLQDEKNNNRPVPILVNNDPAYQSLADNYNNLQLQRGKLLFSIKENNSIIQNLKGQIANLRASMIQSIKSQQNALSINRQKVMALTGQTNALISSVPVKERQSIDLSRQREVEQSLYLFLLQKKEETAIAKAANLPNISIIESPKAVGIPYSPNTNTIYTIAALLGIALPFGIVQLRFLLNKKVMSRDDIKEGTPLPVLGEIGHSPFGGLIPSEEINCGIAEQFRILRTNLKYIIKDKTCPVILVSSYAKGEGKSFVAANLGQMYAISGRKVLLMELDLRQPHLLRSGGTTTTKGFTDYITSNEPIGRFIQSVPGIPDYYILPAGTVSKKPAELLLSSKVQPMMQELKNQFDIILIDAPPAGTVSDAQTLGDYSDVSLYLVRQNITLKNSLEVVNDIVENMKLPNVQLVFNDVKSRATYKQTASKVIDGYVQVLSRLKQQKKIRLSLLRK